MTHTLHLGEGGDSLRLQSSGHLHRVSKTAVKSDRFVLVLPGLSPPPCVSENNWESEEVERWLSKDAKRVAGCGGL
jgi:hypothetical protein